MSENIKTHLASTRKRADERKASQAEGIIGGVREWTEIDFLLRYIDAQKPLTIETFGQLEEYLQDLNYEHGQDATALTTNAGTLFMAYCTDPDGAWFVETGDPRERIEEEDGEPFYNPVGLDWLQGMEPFTILHRPTK
jgi:hypothetical protein